MAFKFNFSVSSSAPSPEEADENTVCPEKMCKSCNEIRQYELYDGDTTVAKDLFVETIKLHDGTIIKYTLKKVDKDDAQLHYDLIPGIYEGGFKVWECAIDLANYVTTLDMAFRGLTVLEVGCGVGIPGLVALHRGASVHFQDYNEDVLTDCTIPSVNLNQSNTDTRYFSGDWSSFQKFLKDENLRYDIILTSETIYNQENYKKLVNLLDTALTENGVIYLASKVHYFGVGGGTHIFRDYLATNSSFEASTVLTIDASLDREILLLKRKEVTPPTNPLNI